MSYADLTVQDKSVSFLHDGLFKLEYGMHHNGYSCADSACGKLGLREALVANLIQKEQLQNRLGAQFTGENLFWGNGVSTIVLREYVGDLDSSAVYFSLDELQKKWIRNSKRRPIDHANLTCKKRPDRSHPNIALD